MGTLYYPYPGVIENLEKIANGLHTQYVGPKDVLGDDEFDKTIVDDLIRLRINEITSQIKRNVRVRDGLVEVCRPFKNEDGDWVIETVLTDDGYACLASLRVGVIWDTSVQSCAIPETKQWVRRHLSSGQARDDFFEIVNIMTHPDIQDIVQEAIMVKVRAVKEGDFWQWH